MLNVIPTSELINGNDGDIIRVAGLVLVRQRPGAAGGICFMTIEDETGNANLVVFRNLFENIYRKEILQSKLIMVEGRLQKEGAVIRVIVQQCFDFTKLLRDLTADSKLDVPVLTLSPRDEEFVMIRLQKRIKYLEMFYWFQKNRRKKRIQIFIAIKFFHLLKLILMKK